MSSIFGENIKFLVFGQSHSAGIGVVIDGLPAGETIDLERVRAFMRRRAPGHTAGSTPRKEADVPRVISGLAEGVTCGAPLCAVIENTDTRPGDYDKLRAVPRPGHADFSLHKKYAGFQDVRGGGHSSGRLTAPLCFAGAVCLQILKKKGVCVHADVVAIGGQSEGFDEVIAQARAEGDSVGGVIACTAEGLPAGLGAPMFGGVENRLAAALFGVPAVRGVEFGAGFAAAALRGSQNNDAYAIENDRVVAKTNHHGGVLGGITTGMPLVLRVAIKPTPSIGKAQQSVDLQTMQPTELLIGGRHDACIVPRAVPVVEAVTACVLLDLMQEK
ncbi:MAG: chorismate synthase [Oscillospiraceae bacterium]|jgi:chorismate synthase|nr:chorismate synthase [Oscillospiraceae bacterium]